MKLVALALLAFPILAVTAPLEIPAVVEVVSRNEQQCYNIPGFCGSVDVADIDGNFGQSAPVIGQIAVYEADTTSVIGQQVGYLNANGRVSKSEKATFTLKADGQGLAQTGDGTCGFDDRDKTTRPFHCRVGPTEDISGALDVITPTGQDVGQSITFVTINSGASINFGWHAKQADLDNHENDVDIWATGPVIGDGTVDLRLVWEEA